MVKKVLKMGLLWFLVNLVSMPLVLAEPSLAPTDSHPVRDIVIKIKTRKFDPSILKLKKGEKARIILRNQDTELHAFVPLNLFQNETLHVSGNGAPEFGNQGLRRVLLPSEGQTEILFVPKRPGTYPFLCDLPGHVMNGTVVVQE